jgi:hypothetical protein
MSARTSIRPRRAEAGLTIVEIVVAAAVLAIGILTSLMVADSAVRQAGRAKEVEVARLAIARAREVVSAVKFRGASSSDPSTWLFRGGYELARNANGTSFVMPDVRTAARVTEDGIAGCVRVRFPVPPLTGVFTPEAGRIIFYVDETRQPTSLPAAAFPFGPTYGLARLDCDGDGLFQTTDLRLGHSQAAKPCRLVPMKIVVEWRTEGGVTERLQEHFLLSYQGYE